MKKILCVSSDDLTGAPALKNIMRGKLLSKGLSAEVYSAGIRVKSLLGSRGVSPRLSRALENRNYGCLASHVPIQINPDLIAEADLVLTTTRDQRERIKKFAYADDLKKVFTLPDYATKGRDADIDILHPNSLILDTRHPEDNPASYQKIAKFAGNLPHWASWAYLHFATPGMVDSRSSIGKNRVYSHLVRNIESYVDLAIPILIERGLVTSKKKTSPVYQKT